MKFTGGKFKSKLPDPLRGLADVIKAIGKLEFGTPAGLVNVIVLALAVVLVNMGSAFRPPTTLMQCCNARMFNEDIRSLSGVDGM